MSRSAALRTVGSTPDLRRITVSYAGHAVAEHSTWLAIMVWAYQQGGIREAGFAAVVQLVPSAIFAPVLAIAGDRMPRERVLMIGLATLGLSMAATGAAITTDASRVVVYAAAIAASILLTVARPTTSALLPRLASTPDELTAANVWVGNAENLGLFVGPAIAGALLARWNPGAVYLVMAVVTLGAAVIVAGVRPAKTDVHSDLDEKEHFGLGSLAASTRLLAKNSDPRLLVILLTTLFVVAGAIDVAVAAVAVELLGQSEAGAGILAMALGVGALVGGLVSVTLVGRLRLSLPVAVSFALACVPLALVGATSSLVLACLALGVSGLGATVSEVAGRTMLQGLAPDDTLARIFGLVEGATMLGLAFGGAAFSTLAVLFGLEQALVAIGLGIPLVAALSWRRLRRIDRDRHSADPALLAAVTQHPIFAPLPAYSIEQLLLQFTPHSFDEGEVLMVEGDDGDDFHLTLDGLANIFVGGELVNTRHGGAALGEIALLRDTARTATVKAGAGGLRTVSLSGDDFLAAVTGVPRSVARANVIAERRLGRNAGPSDSGSDRY